MLPTSCVGGINRSIQSMHIHIQYIVCDCFSSFSQNGVIFILIILSAQLFRRNTVIVFERKQTPTSTKIGDLNNCVLNDKVRPTPFPSQSESSIVCFSLRMTSITVNEAMWEFWKQLDSLILTSQQCIRWTSISLTQFAKRNMSTQSFSEYDSWQNHNPHWWVHTSCMTKCSPTCIAQGHTFEITSRYAFEWADQWWCIVGIKLFF